MDIEDGFRTRAIRMAPVGVKVSRKRLSIHSQAKFWKTIGRKANISRHSTTTTITHMATKLKQTIYTTLILTWPVIMTISNPTTFLCTVPNCQTTKLQEPLPLLPTQSTRSLITTRITDFSPIFWSKAHIYLRSRFQHRHSILVLLYTTVISI